jgi:threonyl-tRNA synthetase
MRLLFLHANEVWYELKGTTGLHEEISEHQRSAKLGECLAVYVSIEKGDGVDLDAIVKKASQEIVDIYLRLKPKMIFLNPFAHLSSDLSPPDVALKAMRMLEEELKKKGYDVMRCPSGWYKRIVLDNKGHPLAALGRSVTLRDP